MVAVPVASGSRPVVSGMHGNTSTTVRGKAGSNGTATMPRASIPLSARRAEALDLTTVERKAKGTHEVPPREHIGGIQDAAVFRPTEEEWKHPMIYMKSIESEGRKYGIVKIIPPESWNPDFVIDTERFHFKTRKQELNCVEGGTRTNLNYLDQLGKFHKQQGASFNRFPTVDKRPLDLYELKKSVERRGGFEQVCKGKRWAEIGRDLGYSGKIMSSLSTSLKNSYSRWLLPYEQWLRGVKPSVQLQLEQERGGPYGTPSPANSPMKKAASQTPSSLSHESPAARASQALNASLANGPLPTTPTLTSAISVLSSGFTAVNAGSFTPVNAESYPPTSANKHETPGPPESHASPVLSTPNQQDGSMQSVKRQLSNEADGEDGEEGESGRRSKRLKKSGAPTITGSQMTQPRHLSLSARKKCALPPGDYCEICGGSTDDKNILLCDGCFTGHHTYCLDPPLKSVPENDWHCPKCLVGTGEFGFEEGGIYSLKQFQERARKFKDDHFAKRAALDPTTSTPSIVTEDDVEKEFWRLASNLMESVEVEYGADIHSTTHGSGFPTMEKQPRNPYSLDPWNLNVLPLDKDSLFRYIKTDISGMTVPWLYVGMCFSTFCWHNEDHYCYSANYQHFGATKTWYGIPGEDATRFEDAMREAVPELFESQPDLLFQLVTLLPPDVLKNAGVNVYAVDQRAGELVVTYPQSYHAGFNHGFNFNEAVNFAPSDWEPFGQSGVERLRDFRRNPCFSHDLLLLTAALEKDLSISNATWLAPALERATERERTRCEYFDENSNSNGYSCDPTALGLEGDSRVLPFNSIVENVDAFEDDYVCEYCKTFTYLSRWTCNKTKKVACLDHVSYIDCECSPTSDADQHTVITRCDLRELDEITKKVRDKANLPQAWSDKLKAVTEDNPKPQLKSLKALLTEGERIPWNLPQLPDLKLFVEKCNEWVEEAQLYITRKQQSRRKSEKTSRKASKVNMAEAAEKEKDFRKLSSIKRLLSAADKIGFECPEIQVLQERADTITEYQTKARKALTTLRDQKSADIQELIEVGKSFSLEIPEIEQLESILKQMQWRDSARDRIPGRTLQEVDDIIKQAAGLNVPELNEDFVFLKEQKRAGEAWEEKAKELMAAEEIHLAQLDALSTQASDLPVTKETLAAVDAILRKQREAQELITSLYERCHNPDIRQRPQYKEVRDVMASLSELSSKPTGTVDLEKEQKRHEDWMRRGKKLFGKSNAPLHILSQHMDLVAARNKACFDLSDQPRGPVEPRSREHTPEDGLPGESSSGKDLFCLCRQPEAGMMIECVACHEWYHSKCLKIARGKVKEDDDFVCPVCDWRVKIPRDANRPKVEDLVNWQAEITGLPFQPEEEETLENIIEAAQSFREFLTPFTSSTSGMVSTMEEVPTQRFYLRKLEGADVLLAYESNFFRQELHRLVPHAPEPPPLLENSLSTRKPRPTKQQKLMASLGIDNPDDIPQHLRVKPYNNKKKTPDEDPKLRGSHESSGMVAQARTGTPQMINFRPPLTSTAFPAKPQSHVSYASPHPQSMHTSPTDLPGNPFRQPASGATSLPAIGSPPAFGKGITASPPRNGSSMDFSNGMEIPGMPWEDGHGRDRLPLDSYGNSDVAQTSNFDSMFADLTNQDDGQDGRSNDTSGGNLDPALLL